MDTFSVIDPELKSSLGTSSRTRVSWTPGPMTLRAAQFHGYSAGELWSRMFLKEPNDPTTGVKAGTNVLRSDRSTFIDKNDEDD